MEIQIECKYKYKGKYIQCKMWTFLEGVGAGEQAGGLVSPTWGGGCTVWRKTGDSTHLSFRGAIQIWNTKSTAGYMVWQNTGIALVCQFYQSPQSSPTISEDCKMNKLKIKHTQGAWMILWLSEGWHRTGTQPHAVYAGEHDAAAINMLVKVLLTMLVMMMPMLVF